MSPSLPGLKNAFLSLLALLLLAVASPSRVLAQAVETEPNDDFETADALALDARLSGSIGADSDRDDYFRVVLPQGGKLELAVSFTSTSGNDGADGFVQLFDARRRALAGGFGVLYNVPAGQTRGDTLRLFGRAPGDTLYVRVYQQSGSLDYVLRAAGTPPTTASDAEPNGDFDLALALGAGATSRGQIGYVRDGQTDLSDYYRVVLPAGGTVELAAAFTSTAGNDGADGFVQLFDARRRALGGGFAGIYNVPAGQTRGDTLRLFGRAPGDTLYVRVYQQSGSLDYALRYEVTAPGVGSDDEPNGSFDEATALAPATEVRGQIGYVRNGQTDLSDYYRVALPAGGSVRVIASFTSTARTDGADGFVQLFDARRRALGGGFAGIYNVPNGETRVDTLYLYGRGPGDTLYVRVYQQSGSLDYTLRYESTDPPRSPDAEPNDGFDASRPLAVGETTSGQIGYVRDGQTDRDDYYRFVIPDGGTVRFAASFTSTAGNDGADGFVQLFDSRRTALGGGFAGIYNVPVGESRADTVTIRCRVPGDTIYVRVYQQSGSLTYDVSYELAPPPFADDTEPNDALATATAVAVPGTYEGRIGYVRRGQTDRDDYYAFESTGATSLRIEADLWSDNGTGGTDLFLQAFDVDGRAISGGFAAAYNLPEGASRHVFDLRCLPEGAKTLRVYQQSGCVAYRLRLLLRDEQPVAAIETSRVGNRFAFGTNARATDALTWRLGDGTSSSGRFPTAEYGIGAYTVTLEVRNPQCRLTARDTLEVSVAGIEQYRPHRAGKDAATGYFTIMASGGGFDEATTVTLSRGGSTAATARVTVGGSNELTALFNFRGVEIGTYDVTFELSDGTSVRFADGFEVYADARDLDIEAELAGPTRLRTGRWQDYTLQITNHSDRVGNGVLVGFVTPREVETDLADVIRAGRQRYGRLVLKGDAWDQLTINREDFEEVYFQGDFDPDVDTADFDFDAAYDQLDTLLSFEIDTLYGEPFRGRCYRLYVPVVRAGATEQVNFRMRGTNSARGEFVSYVLPYTARRNPPGVDYYEIAHETAMQTSAVIEQIPANTPYTAALKGVGKSAGLIDVVSQGAFQLGTDAYYRTFSTERYGTILKSAGLEALSSKLPFSDRAEGYAESAKSMKRTMKRNTEYAEILGESYINSNGRLAKNMAETLGDEFDRNRGILQSLPGLIERADREAVLNQFYDYLSKRGLDLTSKGLDKAYEEFLKSRRESNDPDEPRNPDNPDCSEDGTDSGSGCKPKTTEPKKKDRRRVQIANSFDPNAIYGPDGPRADRNHAGFVRRGGAQSYTVTFENVDTAEIAAQVVRVELVLDPNVYDLSRVVLGDIDLGGRAFSMPDGRREFFRDVDLRPAQPYLVRVSAKVDTVSGAMTWRFVTLDPDTGDVPQDPFAGFLPPNVSAPEGEGGFTFTTFLRDDQTTGDTLGTEALIFFDENEPIPTGRWTNVVDESRPRSSLLPDYEWLSDSVLVINYGGSDRGAGVEDYTLRIRRDTSEWLPVDLSLPGGGSAELILDPERRYEMYVVATDSLGLREAKSPRAELIVEAGQVTVGLRDPASPTPRITLYPNPTSNSQNSVLRSHVDVGRATLEVFDALGRRVRSTPVELSAGVEVAVPTQGLPAGMYLVRVTDARGEEMAARLVVR